MTNATKYESVQTEEIVIKNFKCCENFELKFNEDLNILIGNNEAHKSAIIEVGPTVAVYRSIQLSQYPDRNSAIPVQ
jgi:recombinational DNA repair ATPase RecF